MIEKAINFVELMLAYKDDVASRLGIEWSVRIALQRPDGKFWKWVDEKTFLEEKNEYITDLRVSAIHMTKLPNQLVLELDIEDEEKRAKMYQLLYDYVKIKKWRHLAIWTGNKSIHFHIFFKPTNIDELKAYKKYIVDSLATFFEGFDVHITKETTPFRVPFSTHHKTQNKAEIVVTPLEVEMPQRLLSLINNKDKQNFIKLIREIENPIEEHIHYNNINMNNHNNLLALDYVEKRIRKRKKTKNSEKLLKLYTTLLNLKIEDGRDRVLMILLTLAKNLGLPTTTVEKDIQEWATLNDWKDYRWRPWIRYYEEDRYPYLYNYKWAIKEFLTAKDIEKKDYEKVRKVIGDIFPMFTQLWKR